MNEPITSPDLPNLLEASLPQPDHSLLAAGNPGPPRILLLYGSLRPQSFSRKLALEAERLLRHLGCETRVFDPHLLPMLDSVDKRHPEVQRLREWSLWSEGQVWVSPERHGTITGAFKNQIDWLPLEDGSVLPYAGPHPGRDAGERRFPVVQHGQHPAGAWPLDAHADHSQPVVGSQGMAGIR